MILRAANVVFLSLAASALTTFAIADAQAADDGDGAMAGSSPAVSDAGAVAVGATSTLTVKFAKALRPV